MGFYLNKEISLLFICFHFLSSRATHIHIHTLKMVATVKLYIYDLSQGMAKMMSAPLLGKQIDGVWHTAIVVYDREYFFGSGGVNHVRPGTTQLGAPLQKLNLGTTEIPSYITDLPSSVLQTPFGQMIKSAVENIKIDP